MMNIFSNIFKYVKVLRMDYQEPIVSRLQFLITIGGN